MFGEHGVLPWYPAVARRRRGAVGGRDRLAQPRPDSGGYVADGSRRGDLHLIDGVDLHTLADGSYDVTMSSHVIEHLANPLRALAAWRRVTRPGGHLLLIAPHMSATFDHRRPVTTLAHMVEDFEQGVEESDLTHLEETLRLHDRARDGEGADEEAWAQLRRDNERTRVLHHHTFTTATLLALLDHAGLELEAAEARAPHDIYVVGRWPADGERPDNGALLAARHRSPFRVDRRAGGLTSRDSSGA